MPKKIRYRLPHKGSKPDALFPKEQLNLLKEIARTVGDREQAERSIKHARHRQTEAKTLLRRRESELLSWKEQLTKSNRELEKLRLDLIILLTNKRFYSKDQESKRRREMQAERQKEQQRKAHATLDELESRDVA